MCFSLFVVVVDHPLMNDLPNAGLPHGSLAKIYHPQVDIIFSTHNGVGCLKSERQTISPADYTYEKDKYIPKKCTFY